MADRGLGVARGLLPALFIVAGSLACARLDPLGEHKALVRRYMEEILNQGDFTAVTAVFPDSGFVLNGRLIAPSDLGVMREGLLQRFPDFRIAIEDQIAEGDKVVTRVTFHGTHRGEFRGIPPTGRQVAYRGIAIDRIGEGRVVEGWHQADDLELLRQLGAKITR